MCMYVAIASPYLRDRGVTGGDTVSLEFRRRHVATGDTSLREENAVLRNHVEVLLKELVELKERIDQYDVALATRGMVQHPFMAKDVPKPKSYKGSRNAREIDNFLWSMKVYFNAIGFRDDASKIQVVPLYLEDIATLLRA